MAPPEYKIQSENRFFGGSWAPPLMLSRPGTRKKAWREQKHAKTRVDVPFGGLKPRHLRAWREQKHMKTRVDVPFGGLKP